MYCDILDEKMESTSPCSIMVDDDDEERMLQLLLE